MCIRDRVYNIQDKITETRWWMDHVKRISVQVWHYIPSGRRSLERPRNTHLNCRRWFDTAPIQPSILIWPINYIPPNRTKCSRQWLFGSTVFTKQKVFCNFQFTSTAPALRLVIIYSLLKIPLNTFLHPLFLGLPNSYFLQPLRCV